MTYIDTLLQKHFDKNVLVDTNLLLLLLYGVADRKNVSTKKRTNKYSSEDFDLLYRLLQKFRHILYTPHILTELSNLIEKGNSNFHNQVLQIFCTLIAEKKEIFTESEVLAKTVPFAKFGLTDTAIYDVALSGTLVLTDDLPLYGFLSSSNLDVINFNQLRGLQQLMEM